MALFDDTTATFDDPTVTFDSSAEAGTGTGGDGGEGVASPTLWTRGGKVIRDASGRLLVCPVCPCPTGTGTELIEGCALCYETGTGTYITEPGVPAVVPFVMAWSGYVDPATFPNHTCSCLHLDGPLRGANVYREGYLTYDPDLTLDLVTGFTGNLDGNTSVTGVWVHQFDVCPLTGTGTLDSPTLTLYVYFVINTSTFSCNYYAEVRFTDPDWPGAFRAVRVSLTSRKWGPGDCSCMEFAAAFQSGDLGGTIPDSVVSPYCKGLTESSPNKGQFPSQYLFVGENCSCCEEGMIFPDADYPDTITINATHIAGVHFPELDSGPITLDKQLVPSSDVSVDLRETVRYYKANTTPGTAGSTTVICGIIVSSGVGGRRRYMQFRHTDSFASGSALVMGALEGSNDAAVSHVALKNSCNPIDWYFETLSFFSDRYSVQVTEP